MRECLATVSPSLNKLYDPKFDVRKSPLGIIQKKSMRDEEKASGISPVHSHFKDAMENIIQVFIGKDEEERKI